MKPLFLFVLAAGFGFAESIPLKERVLILINSRMPESVAVGKYYAERRGIPPANILALKTNTTPVVSLDEYRDQIENPLRKVLDAGNGAMRRKIVYIVPVYGIPLKVSDQFAVDSLIVMMYAGLNDAKPPLRNPYYGPAGSRPPKFAEWSDTVAAANNFKMFAVTRLDGPTPAIAKGLVDKAIEAESSLTMKSGVAYFDYQGTRNQNEWQYAVDEEVRLGAALAQAAGFETVLHTQGKSLCNSMIPAAGMHFYDPVKKAAVIVSPGATASLSFPVSPPVSSPVTEADFSVSLYLRAIQGPDNSISLYLWGASPDSYIRLFYPLVPFLGYDQTTELILEKVVGGTPVARVAPRIAADAKLINDLSQLKLSVHGGRITGWRDGAELIAMDDKSGTALPITRAGLTSNCWEFGIQRIALNGSGGQPLWADAFSTDSAARYQWKLAGVGAPNALWAWGWYGQAWDSYRFVPGAVGAQLTSFTAIEIRTPANAAPEVYSFGNSRWGGNWVPRMLEQGVTATWGAVTEPYANYYARGPDVFEHIWAGYNFGDSFYISQNAVRWVMVAIGDPLYAPRVFARRP